LAAGGPIIEPVEGDPSLVDVTLVAEARPDTEAMILTGHLSHPQYARPMERMGDSNVWAVGIRVPADLRTGYAFVLLSAEMAASLTAPIDELPEWQTLEEIESFIAATMPLFMAMQVDPRNPRRSGMVMGDRPEDRPSISAFDAPRADPDPELQPGVTTGSVSEHRLPSRHLNEDVRSAVREAQV
jgi:hypothetical protein